MLFGRKRKALRSSDLPPPSREVRLVLWGPQSSGKNLLLASLPRCIECASHGFGADLVVDLLPGDVEAGSQEEGWSAVDGTPPSRASVLENGTLRELEQLFVERLLSKRTAGPSTIDFAQGRDYAWPVQIWRKNEIPMDPPEATKVHERAYSLYVHAPRGVVCCPPTASEENDNLEGPTGPLGLEQARINLKSALRRSTAVIVCRPIVSPHDEPADDHFYALSTFIGNRGGAPALPSLETIVIAFTYYEMAFSVGYAGVQEYATPLTAASDPVRALNVMARSIQGTRFKVALERLIEVARRDGRPRIVCVPTSGFGFLASDGSANVDLWSGDAHHPEWIERKPFAPELRQPAANAPERSERLAEIIAENPTLTASSQPLVVERRMEWIPFHTLDPIVTCLSGEKGRLTFDAADVVAHARFLEAAGR